MSHRAVGVLVAGMMLTGMTSTTHADDDTAARDKAKQFIAGKHRWSRTAQMVSLVTPPGLATVRASTLVYDAAARQKAKAAGQTFFTSNFFLRVPIELTTTPARAKSPLWRDRLAITFLLATGPTHTEKLSTLAADPYATAALAECASAVADIDLAALQKKHLPTRESQLVAAARAPNHRQALAQQLEAILVALTPDPAAKGGAHKMDPDAHAERVRGEIGQWIAVLPDDDLDLIAKSLLPKLKTMWGAEQLARDVEALLVLYK